jgi:hypothetical protein
MEWIVVIAIGIILGSIAQSVVNHMKIPVSKESDCRTPVEYDWEAKGNNDIGKFNFRKTRWGMSIDEVKESELPYQPNEEASGGNILFYNSIQVVNYNVHLLYAFWGDACSLSFAKYNFFTGNIDVNMDIMEFKKIVAWLKEKYGVPTKDYWNWKNEQFRENQEYYGLALQLGHLERLCQWETSQTIVTAGHFLVDGLLEMSVEFSEFQEGKLRQERLLEEVSKDQNPF